MDAQRFRATAEADQARGTWLDPAAGKVLFGAFAEQWLAARTSDPSTRAQIRSRLNVHILPTFEHVELRAVRPSTVQAWLKGRQEQLAPRTVQAVLTTFSAVLSAAVEDGLLVRTRARRRR